MTLFPHTNDTELFRQIAEGNEGAFGIFFQRYLPRMKKFVLNIVKVEAITDEILQDLFLKIWMCRTDLAYVNNPSAWTYRIASNLAIDHLRRQAVEYKALKAMVNAELQVTADELLGNLTAKQLQQLIYEAVEDLPERRKKIYLLTREQGWSHKAVADHLGISVQTVKNQVVDALKAIQQHILQSGGVYIPLILLGAQINLIKA